MSHFYSIQASTRVSVDASAQSSELRTSLSELGHILQRRTTSFRRLSESIDFQQNSSESGVRLCPCLTHPTHTHPHTQAPLESLSVSVSLALLSIRKVHVYMHNSSHTRAGINTSINRCKHFEKPDPALFTSGDLSLGRAPNSRLTELRDNFLREIKHV